MAGPAAACWKAAPCADSAGRPQLPLDGLTTIGLATIAAGCLAWLLRLIGTDGLGPQRQPRECRAGLLDAWSASAYNCCWY
eukprot:9387102-Alexandrium_andersonii.AAC.1